MNQYIFIDLGNPNEGPVPYQVSAPTVKEAIQIYSKVNNLSLKDMAKAATDNTLYLYLIYPRNSTQGYLTQIDLEDYLEDIDLEIFLEDPYKYITNLLENAGILLDGSPKIEDPDLSEYHISSTIFNYLLSYLLYHAPQKDNNHLVIRYHPSTNTLDVPEYDKEPSEDLSDVNRVYSINYNSYITIHLLIYKN